MKNQKTKNNHYIKHDQGQPWGVVLQQYTRKEKSIPGIPKISPIIHVK